MDDEKLKLERTWLCSVVFADIVAYSEQTVAQQMAWKQRFAQYVSEAIADVPPTDRVILDTGDGAAICFLGDPETAMLCACKLASPLVQSERGHDLPMRARFGINLGPVKLVKDINGNLNALGDGINVAQRVMSFARSNQILVSRSFFEVVSRLSETNNQLFRFEGVRKDKHVREHTLYELRMPGSVPHVPKSPSDAGIPAQTGTASDDVEARSKAVAAPLRAGLRRHPIAWMTCGVLLIAAGVTALAIGWPKSPASRSEPPAVAAERPQQPSPQPSASASSITVPTGTEPAVAARTTAAPTTASASATTTPTTATSARPTPSAPSPAAPRNPAPPRTAKMATVAAAASPAAPSTQPVLQGNVGRPRGAAKEAIAPSVLPGEDDQAGTRSVKAPAADVATTAGPQPVSEPRRDPEHRHDTPSRPEVFVTSDVLGFQQFFGDPALRERGRRLVDGARWTVSPSGEVTFAPVGDTGGFFPITVQGTRAGDDVTFEGVRATRTRDGPAYVRIAGHATLRSDAALTLDLEIGKAGTDPTDREPTYRARARVRLARQ